MAEPETKKKKPNYYAQKKRRNVIEPGFRGFLCSCNFREKECIRESYNILNTYADTLSKISEPADSTPIPDKSSDSGSDIEDELAKEINELKCKVGALKRFQAVDSGAKNFIFIRTTLDNPVEIAVAVINDILESKQQKTRFLLRLIPIEVTCRAVLADIKDSTSKLIDKHFAGDPKTFSVVFNHRNNNQIDRDVVIKEVAELVSQKSDKHAVNLKNPDLSIIVEIIRGVCLLSVVPFYAKYKKYNLLQIAESLTEDPEKKEDK